MTDLAEVDAYSGLSTVPAADVIRWLGETASEVEVIDDNLWGIELKVIDFRPEKAARSQFAVLGGPVVVCTSQETLQALGKHLDIRPKAFLWPQMSSCYDVCDWLLGHGSIEVQGVGLRQERGDGLMLLDGCSKEAKSVNRAVLRAFLEKARALSDRYWLATLVLPGIRASVDRVIIDFDGLVTARRGETRTGDGWVLEALKQYVSSWNLLNRDLGLGLMPEPPGDIPTWMEEIFSQRRWDRVASGVDE